MAGLWLSSHARSSMAELALLWHLTGGVYAHTTGRQRDVNVWRNARALLVVVESRRLYGHLAL
jgi:hypothetical protein